MMINQQVDTVEVSNPIVHLPSFSTADLLEIMRIDKTKGTKRISSYISDAYDEINGQLPDGFLTAEGWNERQENLLPNVGKLTRAYKRAVMHEAAASMADDNIDYDSTGAGAASGDDVSLKSDRLRRKVSHAIADMTGKSRNRTKLL